MQHIFIINKKKNFLQPIEKVNQLLYKMFKIVSYKETKIMCVKSYYY